MQNDKENSAYGVKAIILVIMAISIGYFTINYRNNKSLQSNYDVTDGKIVSFEYNNYAYCLDYEYSVENKNYKNSICGMSKFYSNDSVLGCVGDNFEVKYSKSNPEISEIDLKGFNRYKPFKP
ncbi:MAG: hypothetical protein ACON5F_06515 [Jejuia sp.]